MLSVTIRTMRLPNDNAILGLFLCSNCVYHKAGYIIPCSSFSFELINGKTITSTYKIHFSCDSKDVLFILIGKTCNNFYLEQTSNFKNSNKKLQNINQM